MSLPLRDMYALANRLQTSGVDGYYVPNKYEDPLRAIRARQLQAKKGSKDGRYQTKRGNYIDDINRATKNNPPPGKYEVKSLWPGRSTKSQPPTKRRKTYIDEIIDVEKKIKQPGPGAYKLLKTDEQIKEEQKRLSAKKINGQLYRRNFLDEAMVESTKKPGPGAYNPREIARRVKTERSKPQDWIKKSIEQVKKQKSKPKGPAVPELHPQPLEYTTFQKQLLAGKPKARQKSSSTADDRFKLRQSKIPGPGHYKLDYSWAHQGKAKPGPPKKHTNALNVLHRQNERSIYY